MIQKLTVKPWLMAFTCAILLAFTAAAPISIHAESIDHSVKCGVMFDFDGKGCATTEASCLAQGGKKKDCAALGNPKSDISNVISTVVNILSTLVGTVAVIMIIVGGFKYISSGGDSTKVASAKNTIIYAIVGVIIAALAQVIVRFVLNEAT
jgi:hypothetical protein